MAIVTIQEDEKVDFVPFELKIKVESKEELAVLWAVFNNSIHNVTDNAGQLQPLVVRYFNAVCYDDNFKSAVWDKLNNICLARDLIKSRQ